MSGTPVIYGPNLNVNEATISHILLLVRQMIDSNVGRTIARVTDYTSNHSLAISESGFIFTNLGATGTIVYTLPDSAPRGTMFTLIVQAPYEVRVRIHKTSGKFYLYGSIYTDDGGNDLYAMAQDEGETITFVADTAGNWMTTSTYGTWNIVQP